MVKLSQYLPETPVFAQQYSELNSLMKTLQLVKSTTDTSNEYTYRASSLGVENIYGWWMQQPFPFRQNLIFTLLNMARSTEEVRGPVNHIIDEVFRRGIHWRPKFIVKCDECNLEFQENLKQCAECGKGPLREPDPHQKEKFDVVLGDCNIFDQSLLDVLRTCWFDINITDEMYIYLAKEYIKDPQTNTVRSKPIEIRHLEPALIEYDLDQLGRPKNNHWVCYIHRSEAPLQMPGVCAIEGCELPLVSVMYRYYYRGNTNLWLLDSEVVRVSKFYPGEMMGIPPLLTILYKVLSIQGMDRNVFSYFFERKMPASMVMVFTDDPESLRREREQIAAKMRQDANYIPMVAVSTKQNRGRVDMVRLFHTLQEMDYLPVREEIRQRIAALWGVTPVWQNAPESIGGVASQTSQLVVMSRVVESDQKLIQTKVFPKILDAYGITDWVLVLPLPEEKAEATRIAHAQQRISAANMLAQMGFDVKLQTNGEVNFDDVSFVVSGKAISQREQQTMMAAGGPGGGGGSQLPPQGGGPPLMMSLNKYPDGKMAIDMVSQLYEAGFQAPIIKEVDPSFDSVVFDTFGGGLYKAFFASGKLLRIEKFSPTAKIHRHDSYPPHDMNLPHSVDRRVRNVDKLVQPEDLDIDL